MGQRLNIEIVENGKCLANAYYHWSAYTDRSYELAKAIIKDIPSIKEENPVLKAIKLLEVTGARLMDCELEYADKIGLGKDFETALSRNDGLISISSENIDETRKWQEYALYIHLDENRMNFQVINAERLWTWEKEQEEYYDTPKKREDLEILDIDFNDIKFDKIDEFGKFLKEHKEDSFLTRINQWEVVETIY